MTSPCLADEELGKLYSTYYPRRQIDSSELIAAASKVTGTYARLQRWLAGTDNQGQYSIRPGQIMLDVGCGSGLSLLEAKNLGGLPYGIEADPNVRGIAKKLGLQIHIGSLYDHPFPGVAFDLVVLNQVIEHIPDPGRTLTELRERLKPGGRIILIFPNRASFWRLMFGSRWINWHIPYHLHHFDAEAFAALARRSGYRILKQRTITPNLWTTLQFRMPRQRKLGVPSPLWNATANEHADSGLPRVSRSLGPGRILRAVFRRAAFMIRALTNRIIDLTGYGDSIFVVLVNENGS